MQLKESWPPAIVVIFERGGGVEDIEAPGTGGEYLVHLLEKRPPLVGKGLEDGTRLDEVIPGQEVRLIDTEAVLVSVCPARDAGQQSLLGFEKHVVNFL